MSFSAPRHTGRAALLAAFMAALVALAAVLGLRAGAAGGPGLAAAAPAATPAAKMTPALARLADTRPNAPVEVIVQLRVGFGPAKGKGLIAAVGGKVTGEAKIINGFGASMTAAQAERLAGEAAVRAVTLNGKVRSSGLFTAYNSSVQSPRAWFDYPSATGKGVGVAVIDTGVAAGHADFRTSSTNPASRVVASAVANPNATTPNDTHGHGTHIAGLIAGDGWDRPDGDPLRWKYRGVAPNANLISVKVSGDDGSTSVLDVINGLQFVLENKAKHNIKVANLSLSSSVSQSYHVDPLDAAVEVLWAEGVTVVAAAGNDGDAAGAVDHAPGNDPYVITVGAADDQGTDIIDDDTLAPWSSRGVTADGHVKPEVLAPGARIVSTLAAGSGYASRCPDCVADREYIRLGGTSMAAAIVSGAVADILQVHPNWTPDQVKGALRNTVRNVPGVGGEINVHAAASLADGDLRLVSNVGLVPSRLVTELSQATSLSSWTADHAAYWRAYWRVYWRQVEGDFSATAYWRAEPGSDAASGAGAVAESAYWRVGWSTSFSK